MLMVSVFAYFKLVVEKLVRNELTLLFNFLSSFNKGIDKSIHNMAFQYLIYQSEMLNESILIFF